MSWNPPKDSCSVISRSSDLSSDQNIQIREHIYLFRYSKYRNYRIQCKLRVMQMPAKYQCFLQRPNSEWCLMQITWPMAEEPELWSQISLSNCDTVIVCGVVHNRLSAVFYGISTSISSNKDLQVCSKTTSFPPNQWCIFHTTLEFT